MDTGEKVGVVIQGIGREQADLKVVLPQAAGTGYVSIIHAQGGRRVPIPNGRSLQRGAKGKAAPTHRKPPRTSSMSLVSIEKENDIFMRTVVGTQIQFPGIGIARRGKSEEVDSREDIHFPHGEAVFGKEIHLVIGRSAKRLRIHTLPP